MDTIMFLRWLNEEIDYFECEIDKCNSDCKNLSGNVVAKITYDGMLLGLKSIKDEVLSGKFNKVDN